eukprot:GDKJ01001350.1.p1 GENE.GDKJ01001350.1~~GDKJ01001350.1.p1  ORF type:complete len:421 (-),score=73.17 GDKJ01001350.1:183-1412(-)
MSRFATRLGPGLVDWSENLPDQGRFPGTARPSLNTDRLWRINDEKANKDGARHMIYWVGTKPNKEDGFPEEQPYFIRETYQGQWKENMKHGYGVQTFKNGDRYEGQWLRDKRHGEGVLWVKVPGSKTKFRREFTGGWFEDKRCGAGTCYYPNADRYEGQWRDGKRHGQGCMHYVNGDVYEGTWSNDKRHGYGSHTSANGDVYQGYWFDDLKEGAGALYFFTTGRVLTGEWCKDQMKTGVLCKAEEAPGEIRAVGRLAAIQRRQVPIQKLELKDPVEVLRKSLEEVRKERFFRLCPQEAAEWKANEEKRIAMESEKNIRLDNNIPHGEGSNTGDELDDHHGRFENSSASSTMSSFSHHFHGSPNAKPSLAQGHNNTIGDLKTMDTLNVSPHSPPRKRLGEAGQSLLQSPK